MQKDYFSNLIPILDWNEFLFDPRSFSLKMRPPLETTGFFILDNHPMSPEIISAGKASFEQFFALPLSNKLKHEFPELNHQIGYTPLRIETGVGAPLADEKEFYHVYKGETPQVTELPSFVRDVENLWEEFFNFANHLMEAFALSINEPTDFFKQDQESKGYSLVRGIHYPATTNPYLGGNQIVPGGNATGMCAWEHQDIDGFTLLLAEEKGLELLYEGQWLPVTITKPTQIIVNVGDMMEHITNGVYRSGPHRVICAPNTRRSSIPFFFHFPKDFDITPRPQFGNPEGKYRYKTAGEYLMVRLKEIGLVA